MIIHSTLIKLDYNPSTDVLFVEWPDVHGYSMDKVQETLAEIITTIRHYDVKRLLIDARTTVVSVVEKEYEAIAREFNQQLQTTRLEKLARIESTSLARESKVKDLKNISLITVQSFPTIDEALNWLTAGV